MAYQVIDIGLDQVTGAPLEESTITSSRQSALSGIAKYLARIEQGKGLASVA